MDGKPEEIFIRIEELKELGLDVPFATEFAHRLREKGIDIPESIIFMDELADYISAHS